MSEVIPFHPNPDRAAIAELAKGVETMAGLMRDMALLMDARAKTVAVDLASLAARVAALEAIIWNGKPPHGRFPATDEPVSRTYRRQRVERRLITIRNRVMSVLCVYLPSWSHPNATAQRRPPQGPRRLRHPVIGGARITGPLSKAGAILAARALFRPVEPVGE